MAPGQRGALLAFTTDHTISSFDRDVGQLLWRETRKHMPKVTPIGATGLVLFDTPPAMQAPGRWKPRAPR